MRLPEIDPNVGTIRQNLVNLYWLFIQLFKSRVYKRCDVTTFCVGVGFNINLFSTKLLLSSD